MVDSCTECGARSEHLFSNRPLHKGREATLLICPECVTGATADLEDRAGSIAACNWCGRKARTAITDSARRICVHCADLCRSIQVSEDIAS